MKRFIHAATLAAGLLALSGAQAQSYRYWGAHLGANGLDDWDASVDFGAGITFDGQARLRRGVHGGVQVGHGTAHARYELEYERGALRVERLTLASFSETVNGRGHYDALFANAYRTDRLSERLGTFVGGGLGWGRVKLPALGLAAAGCQCFGPASESGFAWQLRAGLDYRPAPEYGFFLQYTWLSLPAPDGRETVAVDYEKRRFGALSAGFTRRF